MSSVEQGMAPESDPQQAVLPMMIMCARTLEVLNNIGVFRSNVQHEDLFQPEDLLHTEMRAHPLSGREILYLMNNVSRQ